MIRAVLGGSFDPVHRGHEALVQALLTRDLAEEVVVLPAGRSPHKAAHSAGPDHRLAMVRLAFAGLPRVRIDEREIGRPGPSYTVDTLAELAAEDPRGILRLVIGLDNLAGLPAWHRPQAVLDLAELLVFARRGEGCDGNAAVQVLQAAGLRPGPVVWVGDFDHPVSSSEVRAILAAGGDPGPMLAPPVADYIRAHGLYRP